MLSISTGHSSSYLTDQVGAGMEGYYTGAVGAGEPPGLWWGKGAEQLGLEGEVDAEVMAGLYGQYLDPRDERFADPDTRDESRVLGRRPKQFRTPEQVVADRIREYSEEYASTPSPEQVQSWRVEAERDSQSAAHFYDLTFSPDKSVTVLHTSFVRAGYTAREAGDVEAAAKWEWAAAQVEDAIMTASAVGMDYVERRAAYTRTGRHGRGGSGEWQDVHAMTVARFFQHDSRDKDPQLHVHHAVLNKVQGADGVWRALDGKPLHAARAAIAAIAERELEVELTNRLGVSWEMREDGVGRRIAGVDRELEDLFSSRRRAITTEAERRLVAWEEKYGRPATAAERAVIERRSAMATRRAKSHESETAEEQNERWHAMAQTLMADGLNAHANRFEHLVEAAADGRLDDLAAQVAADPTTVRWDAAPVAGTAEQFSAATVMAQALEACHGPDGKATFTRHDLIRQLHLALPGNLGRLQSGQSAALLEQLADQALAHDSVVQVSGLEVGHAPTAARLSDGTAATVNPAKVQYATRGHLAAEMAVLRAAGTRGRTALRGDDVEAWLDAHPLGATLNPAQRAALKGLATSDAAAAVLVGPAGTGKSYTAAAFDHAWRELTTPRGPDGEPTGPGGRAIGVAITQAAADVLAEDGVADTANIAAFLAAQARLTNGNGTVDDERLRLTSQDVLLVDEASMADTRSLNRLQAAVDTAGARLVLMGDPHQLGPVGAGGMMRAAIDRDAETYSLTDVRRFDSAWEREASLTLRDGRAESVGEYDRRGRVLDAGREADAVTAISRAAAADRLAGKDVVVVTATNEHAAQVSAQIRRTLADAGLVGDAAVVLERDGTGAGVGDLVQARRIDRGLGLVNREVYRVDAVDEDGALRVTSTRTGREHVIPTDYVRADVTLAYASTAHGAQGRTVDVGHVLLTPHLDRAGAYVGLTRGRESNTAWAITDTGIPEVPATTGRALLADVLAVEHTNRPPEPGDTIEADAAALDVAAADDARRRDAGTLLGLIEDQTRIASRGRLDSHLDALTAGGLLTDDQRARFGAEQGTEHLARLLRTHELAGRDPQTVLRKAIEAGSLDNALAVSQVIAARVEKAWTRELQRDGLDTGPGLPTPLGHSAPAGSDPDMAGYLDELHGLLDDRRRELGTQLAAAANAGEPLPKWAAVALGPVPPDQLTVDTYASTDSTPAAGDAPADTIVTPTLGAAATDNLAGPALPLDRAEWVLRAGMIAAHREATGWTHPELPLGRCPGVSTPEKRAAWHAAYTAAGMPVERRPEAEMATGRLLVRAKAAERATAAAPPAVFEAQRERHRLADQARRDAVLAFARGDVIEAARLKAEAEQHARAAARLDEVAQARSQWLEANAETLQAGEIARDELARRGITPGYEPDRVTAAEWLELEARSRSEDDAHRAITDADAVEQNELASSVRWPEVASRQAEVVQNESSERAHAAAETAPRFTQDELDLMSAAADARQLTLEVSTPPQVHTEPASTEAGAHRPEVARVIRTMQRADENAAIPEMRLAAGPDDPFVAAQDQGVTLAKTSEKPTATYQSLSAQAAEAEIAAAAAKARATLNQLSDQASHDEAAPAAGQNTPTVEDDWAYSQSKAAANHDELAAFDTSHDRDESYLAAWQPPAVDNALDDAAGS